MKHRRWLAWFGVLAGCGFGDNRYARTTAPDAAIDAPHGVVQQDAAPDTPPPPPPDAPVASCTLVPQSGCTGAACDLDATGQPECRAVTAQGTSNNHCTVDTACKAGYTCVHGGAGETPWCTRFCEHDSDCTGTGSRCVIDIEHGAATGCSNACDPYGQTGCPSGMACQGYDDTAGDFTDCIYPGTTPDGGTCSHDSDCLRGSACVTHGSNSATCESWCVVGNNSTCASGSCVGFTTPVTIGTTQYGVCQ